MTVQSSADDDRPVLVLGPNPTPNGGMHLGHIAGPYLAADVYARYQRARGRQVTFSTGTDDSQTFVVASARRQGVDPQELCDTSTVLIQEALTAIGISYDGFGPFDEGYRTTVQNYFRSLYLSGKFRLKTVMLPYLERTGEYLVEGMVEGDCPVCLATCRGGLCETCNHPNNFDELLNPHSTVDPRDIPVPREATILVFPVEEYRQQLTAYHEERSPYWRPHMAQMLRDVLSRPLADVPITYPLAWGMPAPFEETPGQVLNAWLELIPAGMYTSSYAAGQAGRPGKPGALWRPAAGTRIVHFLGFDNAYYFTMTHMALLMAQCTQFVRPEAVLTNEFYELENEKFSTSKQHVLSVQTILSERPRDIVRLYLASTSPEFQRTSFSRAGLAKLVDDRLVGPWNRLVQSIAEILSPGAPERLPVSDLGRQHAALMLERFDLCYEMPNYSLTRVADTILTHLARLSRLAGELADVGAEQALRSCGDLLLQVQALLALAAPILIDLAEAAEGDGGFAGVLKPGAFEVADIAAFVPPRLASVTAAVPAAIGLDELAGANGLAEVG